MAEPMTEILTDYDPAEDLVSPEAILVFVNEALKTEDAAYIARALGMVARAKGVDGIAREAGLSGGRNPTLKATLVVMKALDFADGGCAYVSNCRTRRRRSGQHKIPAHVTLTLPRSS